MSTKANEPQGYQERQSAPAGQDEVENDDRDDNLQDADTLADLAGLPARQTTEAGEREGIAGLGPDTAQTGTGDRATGVTDLRG